MTNPGSPGRVVLDAVSYVVVLVSIVFAGATAVLFAVGDGWVGVKIALFFVGFGMFGYASLRLRPKPPHKRDEDDAGGTKDLTGFERAVAGLPPLAWYPVDPDARLPPAAKLFVASLCVLAVSFVMEVAFGIVR